MADKVDRLGELKNSHRARPTPQHQPSQRRQTFDAYDAALDDMDSGDSPDVSEDESSSSSSSSPGDDASAAGSTKSQTGGVQVKDESADSGSARNPAGEGTSMPVQKRRRVTRACDECRRKKIKCDGKQPCTHCSVYSYECTYDKPSNRRRNPAPQYIEALESRLQRAEALLRRFMPDVDLADPNLDPAIQQEFRNREQSRAHAAKLRSEMAKQSQNEDPKITSMIETIGQLDLSDQGEWNFHGNSSGAVFLRRMKQHFRGLLGSDYRTPFLPRPLRTPGLFGLDSPRSNSSSPWDVSALPNIYDLPPVEKARKLCYYSLTCATCLLRIVHVPTFYDMFERVYEMPPERFGMAENRFLGLLYSVLALGCMYNTSGDDQSQPVNYRAAMEEGLKYYASARVLLQDVAEFRDLTSLQAFLFMLLFLQVTSNISGCYAFIGLALRSSIRMGLHRHLQHAGITPIEDETRRRCFYVIRQMDTYVSAILGFPMLLNDEDIDQPLPTEVDDEYITKEAILAPPPGTPSFFQAFNAHERLMRILAKTVKYIYPLRAAEVTAADSENRNPTFLVGYAKIREIEEDLQNWYEQLPIHWRPSPDGPIEVIRVRTLLRFSYAHVQMMLYRPFLHYASPRLSAGKDIDERYYACAAAGISVSRNIVHIGTELRKQTVLIGPYWFMLYTQFFAILSLVFYVVENPTKTGAAEILADARAGRDVVASLAQRSMAADRVTGTLSSLFEQLPERLQKMKGRAVPTRKRSAPIPKSGSASGQGRGGSSAQGGQHQRRSEELNRPRTGPPGEKHPVPMHRTSFDTTGIQRGLHGPQFAAGFHDLLPLDIPSGGESSEASSTPGAMHAQLPNFQQMHTPGGSNKPLQKLDEMMFPTNDPFAYPNQQPLMDFTNQGGHGTRRAGPSGSNPQQPGSLQFYIPNLYEDIEGDLLGQLPPYGVPHGHQSQQGLDLGSQMFNPSTMVPTQQQQQGRAAHGQNMTPQQRQQSDLEEMLADPNFRGDWGDILNNSGYRQL